MSTTADKTPAIRAAGADDQWADNPFDAADSLAASNYHARRGGKLVNLSDPAAEGPADRLTLATAEGAFRAFIGEADYPCVGAKSAVNNDSYRIALYDDLGGASATAGLCRDLYRFSREFAEIDARFATFAAVFAGPTDLDEAAFERRFWRQLQGLHDADARLHPWDESVSRDPGDPHFSFSFAGRAFFVVGLHPAASRISRRFPWPTVIFNAHEQFELLRSEGKMERMKQVIRMKDEQLQGQINPVLDDFGNSSEARQYSGRAVGKDWTPPFEPRGAGCPFHKPSAGGRSGTRSGEEAKGREDGGKRG